MRIKDIIQLKGTEYTNPWGKNKSERIFVLVNNFSIIAFMSLDLDHGYF